MPKKLRDKVIVALSIVIGAGSGWCFYQTWSDDAQKHLFGVDAYAVNNLRNIVSQSSDIEIQAEAAIQIIEKLEDAGLKKRNIPQAQILLSQKSSLFTIVNGTEARAEFVSKQAEEIMFSAWWFNVQRFFAVLSVSAGTFFLSLLIGQLPDFCKQLNEKQNDPTTA